MYPIIKQESISIQQGRFSQFYLSNLSKICTVFISLSLYVDFKDVHFFLSILGNAKELKNFGGHQCLLKYYAVNEKN